MAFSTGQGQTGAPFDKGGTRPTFWNAVVERFVRSGSPLLFGVRLWLAVSLALYVAFWLQLDNAFWAGTSAAIVCLPYLGASMRKAWFRMIGTVIGAAAIVGLTAFFPQDRTGFLLSLTLWGSLCALLATLLRNFSAYGAALAGYTAAIIAGDELGAFGGLNGEIFMLAITRVSEIWIGIICAGLVLAGTDFGSAPSRLSALLAQVSSNIASRFTSMLQSPSLAGRTQEARHELIRRVIALDPLIDETLGESSRIRYHSPILQEAIDGLLVALAGWRTISARLVHLSHGATSDGARMIARSFPDELWSQLRSPDSGPWISNPCGLRRLCDIAAQNLANMPSETPSFRLLCDETAEVLAGLSAALNGLALLVGDPRRPRASRRRFVVHVPDWLPALVNAGRAFVTIGVAQLFWITTSWPAGALATTWTSIVVIVLAPTTDESYASAVRFTAGTALSAVAAAAILFAVLPKVHSFEGFILVMALYFVPVGALMAKPWQAAIFAPIACNFLPLLGPANQMTYDPTRFYNNALAIVAGCGFAALSFRLLPSLSAGFRAERLLNLALADLRRVARSPTSRQDYWIGRLLTRLAALPDQAEPLQRARMVAALSVQIAMFELRRTASSLGKFAQLEPALQAFARGRSASAVAHLRRLDQRLAAIASDPHRVFDAARARGQILAIADAVAQHREYFDSGAQLALC
ncbi:putative membrane protein YccC [Bradyrhizobium niftali]|uniref:FUSC family protein n=1 Tax=Bradyrhizobium niftali TaxID=2560055 RepID=UPI0038374E52